MSGSPKIPSSSKPPTVVALEQEALSLVKAQNVRFRLLAQAAFGNDPDPLALFAQEFAKSSLKHVEALLLLQEAHAERLTALYRTQAVHHAQSPLPFPGVLRLLGIVPIDSARFRKSAIVGATAVALVFGLGVLVGVFGVLVGRL